jgi:hypothetical protein
MKAYKVFSLILAVVFAIVGITFLLIPDRVIVLFNELSSSVGMATVPVVGYNFYHILAVGYMYLVTILAALMYRYPKNTVYPLLLCHGKIATATLSFLMFFLHKPSMLYLGNGIVDGGIGIVVLLIYFRKKRADR